MTQAWWRNAVIYQIAPRSFQDDSGDGIGDLAGIRRRLDYVASLGVDAIWITPFYASPMADFGYDVSDFCAVDPLFGSMEDFDQLLERAHELGLKVLIDMVWCHTSDRHPWYLNSRGRGDRSDWYVWADPAPDGGPPNNWQGEFGGPAWTWEPRRRQYYLHHFLRQQPALNWRNPEVADALIAAGRFWLDKGVDGFRLDAVDFLLHDEALQSNPPLPQDEVPSKPFSMQQHFYDMMQPETVDIFARIRALMDEYPGTATMGELSSVGEPVSRAAFYTAPGRLNLVYSLSLMRRPFTPDSLSEIIGRVVRELGVGRLAWAFGNHDIERPVSRWGDESPQCGAMMQALQMALEGALCVYQGEELALPEAELPVEALRDPYGITFWPDYKGRDGCRTPMPWQAEEPHAAFSTADPWLPVPQTHRPRAVDVQDLDANSPLNSFRRLLAWRKHQPALLEGSTEMIDLGPGVLAFRRVAETQGMLCVFNPSASEVRLDLPGQPAEGVGHGVENGQLVFTGWGAAFIPE